MKGELRRSLRDSLAAEATAGHEPSVTLLRCGTYDLKASDKQQLSESLFRTARALEVGSRLKHLVVAGDQQTGK